MLNQNICLILQISHPLPWWQLCTLLAFSQPASWGSHLECISINKVCLVKRSFVEFISIISLSQSVVLWQALFGKIPSPYYGKNSSNKQRETTVHHYFQTWRSVNPEDFKNFERFFMGSRKNHQALWWNWLSWGPPQERKTQSYLSCRGQIN